MAELALQIDDLVKRFGGLTATDHLTMDIHAGEIHAVIGPNGAGKTTLIGQLTGEIRSDSGRVLFFDQDITRMAVHARSGIGLARSFQVTNILQDFTALQNVMLSVQAHDGHSFRFWKPVIRQSELVDPAMEVLQRVGLGDRAGTVAASLSHGEQRQLEIAMALATGPKVLLLDEPMAGMGPEDSQRMVNFLNGLKGGVTILLVEHDMDAVFALADRITVLVYGRAIATGTPDEIRDNEDVRAAYLGDDQDA